MPKLLYHRNAGGVIGASIRLDNGEKVWLLFSRHGCVVRKQGIIFKPRLYSEKNLQAVIEIAEALDLLYPDKLAPTDFEHYPMAAIANAIWHCRTTAEVKGVLNLSKAPQP